jgi:CubicO group peptidase (beta-lactamase class C family)
MRNFLIACSILALSYSSLGAQQSTEPTAKSLALPRSTPEEQGVSSADVLAFVEAANEIDAMHSFMLVRHGKVIAEGWWTPYDAETPHIFFSLSKSFTSTAVGLAVAEGKLSVDEEVLKFFPDEAPAEPSANLKSMRVRDLLRMQTGHQSELALWRDDPATKSSDTLTKRFLAHPVPFKPGTHFLYNSPATYMQSAIVQKVTGMPVLEYLRSRLFEPLGYDNPSWIASPQGVSVGAFGLMGRTEDIAKFGQLYLQKGNWNGKQLIPAAWVTEATSLQTSNGSSPKSDWDQGYGYQFWRSRHNSFRGDGAFGQYCLVLPDQDAVVAITSGVRDMQRVMNLVWDKLLPAMKPKALAADAESHRNLQTKLTGLTMRVPVGKPTVALAEEISGQWFEFPENDRSIQAISLDIKPNSQTLVVRTAGGESRTPIGAGTWSKNPQGFANGLEKFLSVPAQPVIAASGAWTSDDVFTVKLVPYQTPFYSTLSLRFDGDRLLFDSEHNVAFGPTKLPQLIGKASTAK